MFRGKGEIYDRFVGRYSPSLARSMIAAAGVVPGQRALDVGCGSGALVAALAEELGAEHVAAAEELPFEDGEFDATLSQLVVNFLSDPERGLREMARVTRPGGVVTGCVWDYGGGMTMLRSFWEAAATLDPERANPQMEQHTMRFS